MQPNIGLRQENIKKQGEDLHHITKDEMFGAEQESSICLSVTSELNKIQASDSSASNLDILMKEISGEPIGSEPKEEVKEKSIEETYIVIPEKIEEKKLKRRLEIIQENGSELSQSNSLISVQNVRCTRRGVDNLKVSSASIVDKKVSNTIDEKEELNANATRRNNSFSLVRDYKALEASKRPNSQSNKHNEPNEQILKEIYEEIKDESKHNNEIKEQHYNEPLLNAMKQSNTLSKGTGECSTSYTIDQFGKVLTKVTIAKSKKEGLTSQIANESKGSDNLALSAAGGSLNNPLSAYTGIPTSKGTMFQSFSTNKAAFSSGLSGNIKEISSSINIKKLEDSNELKKYEGNKSSELLLKQSSSKFKVQTKSKL